MNLTTDSMTSSLIYVIIFRYSEVMGRSFQPRNVYSGIIWPFYANRFSARFLWRKFWDNTSQREAVPRAISAQEFAWHLKMSAFFDFPTFGKSKIANGKENVIGFAQMLGCAKKCYLDIGHLPNYFLWWSRSGLVLAQLVAEIWHGLTVLFLCSHHFSPHTGWCDPSVTPLHRLPPLLIVMVQSNWCDFAAWLQKGQILRHFL